MGELVGGICEWSWGRKFWELFVNSFCFRNNMIYILKFVINFFVLKKGLS